MILRKDNYIEKIESFSANDWKPLLDLIPEIETAPEFGQIKGDIKNEDGYITMPQFVEASIVDRFRKVVYDLPIIIDFNWPAWDEGRKIVCDSDFDYNSIDIPTKCKIITSIMRNDRFCDGVLEDAFKSGLILKILKSVEYQINTD
ncbi:MAG: hypothetical protein GF372_04830 [Candidatus Marinimicrobia bacterium]|nr:hypothetical protein [Candidatus Neomarinimicrobiota bacterium]